MKKQIIPILLMLFIAISAYSQMSTLLLEPEERASAMAKLSMLETVHDFGTIDKGTPVEHTFVFRNEGDAALIISNVKTSCGCTASDYTKEVIAPGETGEVKATYNAAKEGLFNKSIQVVSNGGEQTLFIKGEVKI
jgi:hypothetical protein